MAKIITNSWRNSKITSPAPKRTRLVGQITYSGQEKALKLAVCDGRLQILVRRYVQKLGFITLWLSYRLKSIRFRDTKHGSRHKNDGFMPANHLSATFWVISCPKRDFDGSRARNRRNHGEIAVCGNEIGEIMAENRLIVGG